jgi:hypothetical protein
MKATDTVITINVIKNPIILNHQGSKKNFFLVVMLYLSFFSFPIFVLLNRMVRQNVNENAKNPARKPV